jgi:streptomycin 6-kinase
MPYNHVVSSSAATSNLSGSPGGRKDRLLDRVSRDLGPDRDRVRRWVLGQTVAWVTDEDEVFQDQIEVARSLLRLE